MKDIMIGDKVIIGDRQNRQAIVEDVAVFVVSKEVSGYYVRFIKQDGTLSKQTGFFPPSVVHPCKPN